MVFLKSMKNFKNTAASDTFVWRDVEKDEDYLGANVSNAIFNFSKNHPFLEKCMKVFRQYFSGRWGSGGPLIFTKVIKNICGAEGSEILNRREINAEKCQGITIQRP